MICFLAQFIMRMLLRTVQTWCHDLMCPRGVTQKQSVVPFDVQLGGFVVPCRGLEQFFFRNSVSYLFAILPRTFSGCARASWSTPNMLMSVAAVVSFSSVQPRAGLHFPRCVVVCFAFFHCHLCLDASSLCNALVGIS